MTGDKHLNNDNAWGQQQRSTTTITATMTLNNDDKA
jgi:hypothetical protein